MLDPRWRKMLRDAWLHKSRSLLVVLAIALGLAGAGAVLNTWALVQRATQAGFAASNPVSATLRVDAVDEALLAAVRGIAGIEAARARRTLLAKAHAGESWRNAVIFALADFDETRIGRVQPEIGAWPPKDGEIWIERSSLEFAGAAVGGSITLKAGDAEPRSLPLRGVARDVSLAPGWMEHVVYGFATQETLATLGAPPGFDEVQILVRDRAADRAAVRRVAHEAKRVAEQLGHRVAWVEAHDAGEHVHAAQMNSLLYTQGAFGLMALAFCGLLVVNLVTAMLAGQVREIGVMKTLGARGSQLGAMYLGLAALLGAAATAIAVPVAVLLARPYAAMKAELLNFPIDAYSMPLWSMALQVAVGLLLPVAAAAIPVARACRMPVASAIRDFGIAAQGGRVVRTIAFGGLGRPLLLSLNNAFRRRQRLLLTLATLVAGGAVYLGAENLRIAVLGSVDLMYSTQRLDLVLRLAEPREPDALETAIARVPGVARVEAWTGASAAVAQADGIPGNAFAVSGVRPETQMLAPRLLQGRWLANDDERVLVISRRLQREEPQLAVGAETTLLIDGRASRWRVAGVVDGGPQPTAYAPRDVIASLRRQPRVSTAVVAATGSGVGTQLDLVRRLRDALDGAGMPVASSQLVAENRRISEDHLLMVVEFLASMAWLMIAIGGMGLASTMGMAVLERTREIGVLRAIGARHRAIVAMVLTEGVVVALLAWAISLPVSIPMSMALAEAFGRVMFTVPTIYLPAFAGTMRWLLVLLGVTFIACLMPALRAVRIPTARALAYE